MPRSDSRAVLTPLTMSSPNPKQIALITGSSGLVGSAVVALLETQRWTTVGLDNNMRRTSSAPPGTRLEPAATPRRPRGTSRTASSTSATVRRSTRSVAEVRPALIVHCAAQPSHDLAAQRPFDDFDVNAVGTLNLLEAARRHCPECAVRVHVDEQGLRRRAERAAAGRAADALGLRRAARPGRDRRDDAHRRDEAQPLRRIEGRRGRDGAGVRPLLRDADGLLPRRLPHRPEPRRRRAARVPRVHRSRRRGAVLRTGSTATGGKQVRDNIHADDVARAILAFHDAPSSGAVYNLGGGRVELACRCSRRSKRSSS